MAEKQYHEQVEYSNQYFIPFLTKHLPELKTMRILEVGCAEAGLLKVLGDMGTECHGIELDETRAALAKEINPGVNVIVGDITDTSIVNKFGGQFDLIIMREVIEHVPDKDAAFRNLNAMLKEGGYMFMSFPPKWSGFAGHQQVGRSLLRFTPYVHFIPKPVLRMFVKMFNEYPNFVEHVEANYSTGIKINQFEKLCRKYNFRYIIKDYYLFRPIYKFRFGLPTLKIPGIPLLREFFAFGCECLLKKQSG